MERKINQRVLLTKRLIQEGLLRLLSAKKVENINVSELCREAGVNRATFYKHYFSPHDVLAEIEANIAKELDSAQYRIVPKESSTTVSRLEGVCTYLKDNASTVRLLVESKMDSDLSKVFQGLPNDAILHIENSSRFEAKGKSLVSCFLSFGLYSLIIKWLIEDMPLSPRDVAVLIDDLSRNGWIM